MIEYDGLWPRLAALGLGDWKSQLQPLLIQALSPKSHGDLPHWQAALAALPPRAPSLIDLNQDGLQIGQHEDLSASEHAQLRQLLHAFHPWRKGPFSLFGLPIDAEWRSDWKWRRIAPHLNLRGKAVLDVGCGNGYYGWRMCGAGAALVLGVDPTLRYVAQYAALHRYIGEAGNHVLPLAFEALPKNSAAFDLAFSMGVIYHRRDPLEHLARLRGQLRPGGTLVLEGLVLAGEGLRVLHPEKRYAKMKNVYAIPTVAQLEAWLEEAGFTGISVLDVSPTSTQEQQRTPWMRFESLADFLDAEEPGKTIEGYPAPIRACLRARSDQTR